MNKNSLFSFGALTIRVLFIFLVAPVSAMADGGEVLSARQISNSQIELDIKSSNDCNDPLVTLKNLYSFRAAFGPHFYEVNVTPQTKMVCFGEEAFTVVVEIPEFRKAGDHLWFLGDNASRVRVILAPESSEDLAN